MAALDLLKAKLVGTQYADNTDLLDAYIQDATDLCKNTLYPFSQQTPPDTLPDRYSSWIARAALEMISKIGGEGETEHSENGVTRYYSAGTVSKELLAELTPIGMGLKA